MNLFKICVNGDFVEIGNGAIGRFSKNLNLYLIKIRQVFKIQLIQPTDYLSNDYTGKSDKANINDSDHFEKLIHLECVNCQDLIMKLGHDSCNNKDGP